jgi:hypothetical protein
MALATRCFILTVCSGVGLIFSAENAAGSRSLVDTDSCVSRPVQNCALVDGNAWAAGDRLPVRPGLEAGAPAPGLRQRRPLPAGGLSETRGPCSSSLSYSWMFSRTAMRFL